MARQGRNGQLPERQARFVREYLKDQNATQAAIRAGYSRANADKIGSQVLGKPRVAAAIEQASKKINDKLEISAERIKRALALKAFANMEDYVLHENGDVTVDLSKCTRDQMAAVREYTVDHTGGTGDGERKMILRTRIKLSDDIRALELLARMRGIDAFADNKVQVSGSISSLSDDEVRQKFATLMAEMNGPSHR